jgi:hypothetical protein
MYYVSVEQGQVLTGIIEDWKNVAYQGPLHWAYNGERLTDLRNKKTTSI